MRNSVIAIIALLFISLVQSAHAASGTKLSSGPNASCIGGVCFPSQALINSKPLVLRGVALLEWFYIDVYSAAFYTAEHGPSDSTSTEKLLVLKYHQAISKDDFCQSTKKMVSKNPTIVQSQELASDLNKLCEAYEDVSSGDSYSLQSLGDESFSLLKNNREVFSSKSPTLRKALFDIWLSDHSVDRKFTRQLLGN